MSAARPGLYLSSTGSYPRIGDSPELQLLRKTIRALDRGERTTADLLDAEQRNDPPAIADQMKAGLDVITDGLVRWYDPISHLAGKLENVKIRGLCDSSTRIAIFASRSSPASLCAAARWSRTSTASRAMPSATFQRKRQSWQALHQAGPHRPVHAGKVSQSEHSGNGDSDLLPLSNAPMAYAEALAAEFARWLNTARN